MDKHELDCSREQPLAAEEWLASHILECMADPRAVCRLALVNKNFSVASVSDTVWQKLLPPPAILNPLLAHVNYQPPSKKHLFIHLCKSITYDQGLKKFWLDPASGGECHMISARALSIIWGDTPQYWHWEPYSGSMFSEVACLDAVCWFDVKGTFRNVFRPGRYMVSFRLQLHSTQGWQRAPVKLCIQNMTCAHPPHESQVLFDGSSFRTRPCPSSSMFATSPKQATFDSEGSTANKSGGEGSGKIDETRGKTKEETEVSSLGMQGIGDSDHHEGKQGQPSRFSRNSRAIVLGNFSDQTCEVEESVDPTHVTRNNEDADQTCEVEESVYPTDDSRNPHIWVECDVGVFVVEDDNENRPIEVNFSMKEIDGGMWKGGLFLDGAIIRPSYVVENIDNDGKKTMRV